MPSFPPETEPTELLDPARLMKVANDRLSTVSEEQTQLGSKEDIVVASFPRSGTTWIQAIVQLIFSDDLENMSNIGAKITDNWTTLDIAGDKPANRENTPDSHRLLKTSILGNLIPTPSDGQKFKVIYLYRNPKDVMVSHFNFNKSKLVDETTVCARNIFENFCRDFMESRGPYAAMPYFENLKSYWAKRNDPDFLLLSYDDMHLNHRHSVQRIADFIGKDLEAKQLERVVHLTSFEEMGKFEHLLMIDPVSNISLIQCGKTMQWVDYFSTKMRQEVDTWIADNLSSSDLREFSF